MLQLRFALHFIDLEKQKQKKNYQATKLLIRNDHTKVSISLITMASSTMYYCKTGLDQ